MDRDERERKRDKGKPQRRGEGTWMYRVPSKVQGKEAKQLLKSKSMEPGKKTLDMAQLPGTYERP